MGGVRGGRGARGAGVPVGREGFDGDDPGREAGGEALAQEWAERLVLPGLDVAGRPVVEQREAEEVGSAAAMGMGLPRGLPVPM